MLARDRIDKMEGLSGSGSAAFCTEAVATGGEGGRSKYFLTTRPPATWRKRNPDLFPLRIRLQHDAIYPNGFRDVFGATLSQVLIPHVQLVLHLVMGAPGNADPSPMRRPYSSALALRTAASFRLYFSADKEIHGERILQLGTRLRNRIMPPCLPGQFCDRLEELQIEGVRRIYSSNRSLSNKGGNRVTLLLVPLPATPSCCPLALRLDEKRSIAFIGVLDYVFMKRGA